MDTRSNATSKRTPVIRTLLWEQWRQTWLILAVPLAFALLTASSILFIDRLHPGFANEAGESWIALNGFCLAIAFLLVPFSHCDKNNLQAGLPQRTLALPISTRRLGATYLGYRTLALAATALVITILGCLIEREAFRGPREMVLAIVFITIAATVLYAYAQAILWTVGTMHLGIAAILFVALAPALAFLYQLVATVITEVVGTPYVSGFGLPPLLALAFAGLAYVGFSRQRAGVRTGIKDALKHRLTFRRRTGGSFVSPEEAQCWFEGRRKGRIFLIATLGFMVFFWLFFLFATDINHPRYIVYRPQTYLTLCCLSLGASALLTGMLSITFDYRDHATGLTTFTMARSLPTRTFAVARLKAAARSIATTYLILLAGLALLIAATGAADPFARMTLTWIGYDHVEVTRSVTGSPTPINLHIPMTVDLAPTSVIVASITIFLFAVIGHALLTWAVITCFGPLMIVLTSWWLLIILFANFARPRNAYQGSIVVASALALTIAFLTAVILWARRNAKRKHITSPPATCPLPWRKAGAALILTGFFYILCRFNLTHGQPPSFNDVALPGLAWLGASLACFTPSAVTPVWLHWLRHR